MSHRTYSTTADGSEHFYGEQRGKVVLFTAAQVNSILASPLAPVRQAGDAVPLSASNADEVWGLQHGKTVVFTAAALAQSLSLAGTVTPGTRGLRGAAVVTSVTGDETIYGMQGGKVLEFGAAQTSLIVASLPLSIFGAPAIATVGSSSPFTPTISGGATPYTLTLFSGALPDGRAVVGNSVTGTYTTSGTFSYVLRVTDALGAVAYLPVESAVIAAPGSLAITGSAPAATQGVAYSFTPSVTGGSGTRTFALTGTLPTGLTFSTTTGVISGTPTTTGTFSGLSIAVTDTGGGSANLPSLSIVVGAALTAGPSVQTLTTIPFTAADATLATSYTYEGGGFATSSGAGTNATIISNSIRISGATRIRWNVAPIDANQPVFFDWTRHASGSIGSIGPVLRQSSSSSTICYPFLLNGDGTLTFNIGATLLGSGTWAAPAVGATAHMYAKATTAGNGDVILSVGTAVGETMLTEVASYTILAANTSQIITATNFVGIAGSGANSTNQSIDNLAFATAPVTVTGTKTFGAMDYAVIDQPLTLSNYTSGDDVQWTRDGLVVSTSPTYRVSEADVRADKTLSWIRGFIRKAGKTAFLTHTKPIKPIIYSAVNGVTDENGRRVGSDGRPMLRPRPASEDGANGFTLGRAAKLVFVDGIDGNDTYDGTSPWPGFLCVVNYSATGFAEISKGAATVSTVGPKATMGAGAALVNNGASTASMNNKFGDWLLVADGADYAGGAGAMRYKGGYSPAYPTVLCTYSHADPADNSKWGRVPVRFGTAGPTDWGFNQGSAYLRNFVLMGFRYVNNADSIGFTFSAGPSNTTCFNMHWIGSEVTFSEDTTAGRNDNPPVTFAHCSFAHSYGSPSPSPSGVSKTQGLFMDGKRYGVPKRSLHGCVFYMNGWNESRDSDVTGMNFYNHNWYMSEYMDGVEIRTTLSSEAALSGANQRNGGWLTDCSFIKNPAMSIGGYVNSSANPDPVPVVVQNIMVLSANQGSSPGRPNRGAPFQSLTTKNGLPGSFMNYNLVATGTGTTESNPIMVWAPNSKPSYANVLGNTQRTAGGVVSSSNLSLAVEGNPSLVFRTDDNNIYSHGEGLSGTTQAGFTLATPTGTNVDSTTVTYAQAQKTEEQWAVSEGYASYADMMEYAILHPLDHWSLKAIGYCVPSAAPPRSDARLYSGGKAKGAVTPAGSWNDGSLLDLNGYPTGVMA